MRHNFVEDDFVAYRKKSSRRPPAKSKHKHQFEPCVLEHTRDGSAVSGESAVIEARIDGYCPICGKIGPIDQKPYWKEGQRYFLYRLMYHMRDKLSDLGLQELDRNTRTLPTFQIQDPWKQKYVFLEKGRDATEQDVAGHPEHNAYGNSRRLH